MPQTNIKNPKLYKHVSNRLRSRMWEKDTTELQLSRVTGIPAPSISRYMRADCMGMTLHLLVAIADALDTSVEELMEGYEHE